MSTLSSYCTVDNIYITYTLYTFVNIGISTFSGGLLLLPLPGFLPLPGLPQAGQEEEAPSPQDGPGRGTLQEEEPGGDHHLPLGVPPQAPPGIVYKKKY